MSKKKTKKESAVQPANDQTLVVGLGASAGGVEALSEFFEQVVADSGLAYVVILHLSPDYDSQLTEILQRVTSLPVIQVTKTVAVQADHVYVVPPNRHLQMQDGHVTVLPNARLEDRRAPVDIFLSHPGRIARPTRCGGHFVGYRGQRLHGSQAHQGKWRSRVCAKSEGGCFQRDATPLPRTWSMKFCRCLRYRPACWPTAKA